MLFRSYHGAHTVGAPDGGPGLWMVNWSTTAGDLRISHALGLHALQILPLAGWMLSRATSTGKSLAALTAIAIAYSALTGFLLWEALAGRPDLITRTFASLGSIGAF